MNGLEFEYFEPRLLTNPDGSASRALADVAEEDVTPLARMAGCIHPGRGDDEGGKFLLHVRDEVVRVIREANREVNWKAAR